MGPGVIAPPQNNPGVVQERIDRRAEERELGIGLSEVELARRLRDAGLPYDEVSRLLAQKEETRRLEQRVDDLNRYIKDREERWREEDKSRDDRIRAEEIAREDALIAATKQREDTAIQRKVADAQRAGLSPMAALGASTPSVSLGGGRISSGGRSSATSSFSAHSGMNQMPMFTPEGERTMMDILFPILLGGFAGGIGRSIGRR